ncbi:hypothetical protein CHARACLAT_005982 [Characodon lateralis]|uniref:Uncharacterized protein n=1 Tax=Characodon lateralis TaxID=208331 RepID=A0ABU7F0L8_9TELE|nr:hypothetical protein [Characodon lateralis]
MKQPVNLNTPSPLRHMVVATSCMGISFSSGTRKLPEEEDAACLQGSLWLPERDVQSWALPLGLRGCQTTAGTRRVEKRNNTIN